MAAFLVYVFGYQDPSAFCAEYIVDERVEIGLAKMLFGLNFLLSKQLMYQ